MPLIELLIKELILSNNSCIFVNFLYVENTSIIQKQIINNEINTGIHTILGHVKQHAIKPIAISKGAHKTQRNMTMLVCWQV